MFDKQTNVSKLIFQAAIEQDSELELRLQLKRQLYILQEFFKEQLVLYKTELKRKMEVDLKNKVFEEKEKVANQFEESFNKLKQMESLLEGKVLMIFSNKNSQHFYIIFSSSEFG